MAGGEDLLAGAQEQLAGRNDARVETTACAFICGVAPAASVDGRWLGRLDAVQLLAAIPGGGS